MVDSQQLREMSDDQFAALRERVDSEYYYRMYGFEDVVECAKETVQEIIDAGTEFDRTPDLTFLETVEERLHLLRIVEADEWHCYEDGESVTAEYSLGHGDEGVRVTYTVHSSKHTYTSKIRVEFRGGHLTIGRGDYYQTTERTLDIPGLFGAMGLEYSKEDDAKPLLLVTRLVSPFFQHEMDGDEEALDMLLEVVL